MTERKRERTKERSTNPRREFFCNFAWTSPLISTKQIHHGIIHGLTDTFAIAFCSILPSEKTIQKPILADRVYALVRRSLESTRKQFLALVSAKRGFEWDAEKRMQNLQGKRKEIERWWTLAARNVWAYPFVISCAPSQLTLPLSPWLFVIGVYIMDGPFYPRQLTPPNPPSPPPFDLREDLHYKYVPTGMHVRQYDGSLFPFLSPILLSVPPILTSSLCLSIVLRYRE